jgi:colicin import membrane protein
MTSNRATEREAKAKKLGWASPENRRSLVFSVLLHLVMVAVLLVSWDFSESVKRVDQPSSIKARVLSSAELEALRAKSEKKQQQKDKALQDAKKKAEQEAKKKQRLKDEKRRKELAKKKAAQQKKEEAARKKALIKKKEKEQKDKKAREEKAAREQREERVRREQAQRQKEQDAKAAEERARKQQERERHLAERLAAANEVPVPEVENTNGSGSQAEISERDRFIALIRRRVESRWHIPPKSRGLKVVLRINLLPSGERSRVQVVSSSGNKAFDTSALNAVNSVRVFPVPSDPVLFDRYFRSFLQSFSPPEE